MKKVFVSAVMGAIALVLTAYGDGAGPIAQWSFEDAENLGADSIGNYPFSPVAGSSSMGSLKSQLVTPASDASISACTAARV